MVDRTSIDWRPSGSEARRVRSQNTGNFARIVGSPPYVPKVEYYHTHQTAAIGAILIVVLFRNSNSWCENGQ